VCGVSGELCENHLVCQVCSLESLGDVYCSTRLFDHVHQRPCQRPVRFYWASSHHTSCVFICSPSFAMVVAAFPSALRGRAVLFHYRSHRWLLPSLSMSRSELMQATCVTCVLECVAGVSHLLRPQSFELCAATLTFIRALRPGQSIQKVFALDEAACELLLLCLVCWL